MATEYDSYGFPIEEHIEECKAAQLRHQSQARAHTERAPAAQPCLLHKKLTRARRPFAQVLPRQRKAWAELTRAEDFDACLQQMARTAKGKEQLKKMVREGVPAELRPQVWHCLAGASAKRSGQVDDGYYARLLESVDQQERRERELLAMRRSTAAAGAEIRSELISTLEQIEKDVGRTFPGHRTFTHSADGQAQLRRVLRAYCAGRNLHTGYCQGMNFVAATLLLVMSTEEDAFWMFLLTMERLLPADYYTDGLTGVRIDSQVLITLMKERLPSLHAHFEASGVLPLLPIVTTQWFIALFVFWLPTESLMRLWDCFYFEGLKNKNKIFFRAALTLFKLHEKELKQLDDVQASAIRAQFWRNSGAILRNSSHCLLLRCRR